MSDDNQLLCSLLGVRKRDCAAHLLKRVNECTAVCAGENYLTNACAFTMAFPDNADRVPLTCSQFLSELFMYECDDYPEMDCNKVLGKDEKDGATNSACLQYVKKVDMCEEIADAAAQEYEVLSGFLDLERSTFMNYALQMNVMDIEEQEYGETQGLDIGEYRMDGAFPDFASAK